MSKRQPLELTSEAVHVAKMFMDFAGPDRWRITRYVEVMRVLNLRGAPDDAVGFPVAPVNPEWSEDSEFEDPYGSA